VEDTNEKMAAPDSCKPFADAGGCAGRICPDISE
jgi:hypothetical protein